MMFRIVFKYGIEFDPLKDHFVILYPAHGDGEALKFLGIWIDAKLTISTAMERLASKIRPKVEALLRTRAFYIAFLT